MNCPIITLLGASWTRAGRPVRGESIAVAGEHLSGAQMAAQLSQALGEPVSHWDMSPEEYRALGFPGADDLGNMFQFKRDYESFYCGARDIAKVRALNPRLQSFAAWLAANKRRIPLQ